MNLNSPWVIYGLLVAIGVLGAVADSLIFKAASLPGELKWLAAGVALWLCAVALVYCYFRIDKQGFTAAVLIMIAVHSLTAALIDWLYLGGTIGRRELLGFALAMAAIVVLDGREKHPDRPPTTNEEARP